jgi:hypothetical protein
MPGSRRRNAVNSCWARHRSHLATRSPTRPRAGPLVVAWPRFQPGASVATWANVGDLSPSFEPACRATARGDAALAVGASGRGQAERIATVPRGQRNMAEDPMLEVLFPKSSPKRDECTVEGPLKSSPSGPASEVRPRTTMLHFLSPQTRARHPGNYLKPSLVLDGALYDAFNTHNTDLLMSMFSDDLECYHDTVGLTGYGQTRSNF